VWHSVVVGVLVAVLFAVTVAMFVVAESLDVKPVHVADQVVCALDIGCK